MFPDDQPLKVLHTQLGIRPAQRRKRLFVPDLPEARSIFGNPLFTVFEQNDLSKYNLNAPEQLDNRYIGNLERVHSDFGPWLVGDFGHITAPGVYQAYCGNTPGPSFAIRDDVYVRVIPECLRYFQVQACGRNVPGWHDTCHLDDGYIVEEDRYVDAAGGWHDAGDFRKWATSTAMIPIALLVGHRLWTGREEQLGIEPGAMLREARHGVDYFLNIQQPDGRLLHNIGGGRETFHDNLDCRFTDNVPRSGDERRIWAELKANPPGKFTTLFALYANALADPDDPDADPEVAARCLDAARRSAAVDAEGDGLAVDELQWRAWGELELWRATADDAHRDAGVDALNRMIQCQVVDYIGGQSITRGFFRAAPQSDQFHRKHIGADYAIWTLAQFIEALPDHPDAARWRDAVAMWYEDFFRVFAERNPFGLPPYGLYETPPDDRGADQYRRLGDGLCFRYFMRGRRLGSNARLNLAAAALAAAAKALDQSQCLDHAYPLLEWTLGANPFQLSMMNGVGVRQPSALAFQTGNIPGGVTLGIAGDELDMPWYPHPFACCDEYYGYQTAHFLWALLALQDLDWNSTP